MVKRNLLNLNKEIKVKKLIKGNIRIKLEIEKGYWIIIFVLYILNIFLLLLFLIFIKFKNY